MRVTMSRRARWAVPGAAVVVTGAVIAALQIPAAEASPNLPAKTPAQLLASLSSDSKVPPLTGTVVETASLGLPQLPQMASATSPMSLLTGSHTVKVYYQDSATSGWRYRSSPPRRTSSPTGPSCGCGSPPRTRSPSSSRPRTRRQSRRSRRSPPTPRCLHRSRPPNQILAKVGPTTLVSVQDNVMVAGEPAYQLVLAPKDTARSSAGW